MEIQFDFSKNFTKKRKIEFTDLLKNLSDQIGFKVSSRGWCYIMEQSGFINKDQFDKVSSAINDCRKEGFLPVDFVAEESSRAFSGVEEVDERELKDILAWMLSDVLDGHNYYKPDWWEGEGFYIQMVVEKIDLVTLFSPVCRDYHVPIANAKGWSSISQRAEYARRFKEAEDKGLRCVLLYCGDHDPDGLRISETLRSNLRDVSAVYWSDGETGYDPRDLIIDRFGLNYDFINSNGFTWIDNLITSSGKDLSNRSHRNFSLPYVQDYLKSIGPKKCEANVIVTKPKIAKALVKEAIERYLGPDAPERFQQKRDKVTEDYDTLLKEVGIKETIIKVIKTVRDHED